MKNFSDKKIYLVTDYRIHFEELLEKTEEALKAGVKLIQYRDKDISTKLMCDRAEKLCNLCKRYNAIFLVNDRVDVAMAIDADGVHVGQDDMECSLARNLLGADKIIGVSTKTLEESKKALDNGADYLGCGAIYSTSTKDTSVLSISDLKEIKDNINLPIYGIGGINTDNITNELKDLLDGVAVITAILNSDNIKESINKFKNMLEE
ncbi:thiamine phosphate synthase [Clostridium sardiniense]|uniref:Thiamine-phosphate synthase n=1 Tax=Clostridium sardiniense TaxID=29369 RepID=A0ABS7L0U6_CLOSR|nr:thiamine phosphate synthase [Clostridium sardiniense]MBY0756688.1 thiamine phosphate synthase [Clostridium sardiniense]MDQ0458564.1 thiamine-phosphate pyrophosphorylase [Clostridium sardiniense]